MAVVAMFFSTMLIALAAAQQPRTPMRLPTPRLLLGPTANHPDTIADETLALVANASGQAAWEAVRGRVVGSGGSLHMRNQVFGFMHKEDPRMQATLAAQTKQLGLHVSIEAGGALCGEGSGATAAAAALKNVAIFLDTGGALAFWALESIFSRTHRGCAAQPLNTTVAELAAYAGAVAAALPATQLFLYDALPHYSVGSAWPPNLPGYGLELGEVLTLLRPAMLKHGATLAGYWADCPFEYSAGTLDPLPGGKDGFKKVAAAVKLVKGMGLQFGKTFNSQAGGQASDKAFHDGTLQDYARTAALIPSEASAGYALDFVMVETWYAFPDSILPETKPYTTTFTARAVFDQIGGRV